MFSCKKDKAHEPAFSEARYTVEITGKWKQREFGVPPNVHFTAVLGMVHNDKIVLWKENEIAGKGVENVAESGNPYPLLTDIDMATAEGKAISVLVITPPPPTGNSSLNIYCNSNYSYISLETMLAPTPDWFTGISGFNLYPGNKWIRDTTINLYAWDAGTEDGDVFGYSNPVTTPQQPVDWLQVSEASVLANGNPVLSPIAILRFVKQWRKG